MDNPPMTVEQVKSSVRALVGRRLIVKVNNSRNRFVEYDAIIDKTYPNVFTIQAIVNDEQKTLSYSYSEVLTKTVRFYSHKR